MFIDRFRLLDTPGKVKALGVERTSSTSFELRHLEVVFLDMFPKDINRIHRHRTIDVHWQNRDFVFNFEFAKHVEQLLRPSDREGRNQNRTASLCCGDDNVPELFFAALSVFVCVQAIPVGGLQNQVICGINRCGIENNRLIVTSNITCEEHYWGSGAAAFTESDKRGTQDVSRVQQVKSETGG